MAKNPTAGSTRGSPASQRRPSPELTVLPSGAYQIKEVPVQFGSVDEVQTALATNMAVQIVGDNIFVLSFFEARPPLLAGTPEQQYAQAGKVKSVTAKNVARIAVGRDHLEQMLLLLASYFPETFRMAASAQEQEAHSG